MKYPNNLYYLRLEKSMTQKEFAEELGMTAGNYSRYERGENDLPLSLAKNIAEIFGTTIDYIAGMEEIDYSAVGEGQAYLEERMREQAIDEYEARGYDYGVIREAFKDEIKETIEPLVKRIEAIEKKLSADKSVETDSDQSED